MPDSLFYIQDVHPSNCLGVIDPTVIDLGRLQILVPQDNFRYDLNYTAFYKAAIAFISVKASG
jgi:hypothetical protein